MSTIIKKFVISLDSTPQRLKFFRENNPQIEFEHFSAIDGRVLHREELIAKNWIEPECQLAPAAIGCALSHIFLWNRCVNLNRPITVLEDDAILHPLFDQKCNEAIKKSSYSFVMWGWNFDAPLTFCIDEHLCPGVLYTNQSTMIKNIETYRKKIVNPRYFKLLSCYGTIGYSITPEIAKYLLSRNYPLKNRHSSVLGIDMAMNLDYALKDCFISIPPMVLTRNDKTSSTINLSD